MAVDLDGHALVAVLGCGEIKQYTPDGARSAIVIAPRTPANRGLPGQPGGTTFYLLDAASEPAPPIVATICSPPTSFTPSVPLPCLARPRVRASGGPTC